MSTRERSALRSEIELIRKAHKGALSAKIIVDSVLDHRAKYPALSEKFPTIQKAAYQHYLEVARDILKVHVTIIPNSETGAMTVQAEFVSVKGDGSYTPTVEIMSKKATRELLLQQTLRRLQEIREVSMFPELRNVATAINSAASKWL